MAEMTISCTDCALADDEAAKAEHCADCIVTFISGRDPDDALVIDAAEARAMRLLANAGLIPRLRHERRAG